ncbi:MAG TPA: hypothetical protein VNU84_06665 [Candidatus Acidoferrum sp.]|jgi:hypothetical protein|nr:hypothetical protein [Candidatus Acidoferrum sp.]
MRKAKPAQNSPPTPAPETVRPLSALLSQILVAYTLEFDNEFEREMGGAAYAGARLSLVIWLNLIRFIPPSGISVRELTILALAPQERIKHQLGCLERWGFVALQPHAGTARNAMSHGWGSGRGITAKWSVRLSAKGEKAVQIWPPLFATISRRWRGRFGDSALDRLNESLCAVVSEIDIELPYGLADVREVKEPFPPRISHNTRREPLPILLSQLLTLFAVEFEPQSLAPLVLCANVLRVLSETPVPLAEIPRRTGGSPEMTDIGWRLKPFVIVESDTVARRRSLRLSPLGREAQQNYQRLVSEIEGRWETRFGKEKIRHVNDSLNTLFDARKGDRLLIAEGMIPPPGVVRAGDTAPALGRRDVGSAAKQRARDLVGQTRMFVADPVNALPHFPLFDMNRGFGP